MKKKKKEKDKKGSDKSRYWHEGRGVWSGRSNKRVEKKGGGRNSWTLEEGRGWGGGASEASQSHTHMQGKGGGGKEYIKKNSWHGDMPQTSTLCFPNIFSLFFFFFDASSSDIVNPTTWVSFFFLCVCLLFFWLLYGKMVLVHLTPRQKHMMCQL